MKFFSSAKEWTDAGGADATVGKLLEALDKVNKKGLTSKVLSQLNKLNN